MNGWLSFSSLSYLLFFHWIGQVIDNKLVTQNEHRMNPKWLKKDFHFCLIYSPLTFSLTYKCSTIIQNESVCPFCVSVKFICSLITEDKTVNSSFKKEGRQELNDLFCSSFNDNASFTLLCHHPSTANTLCTSCTWIYLPICFLVWEGTMLWIQLQRPVFCS